MNVLCDNHEIPSMSVVEHLQVGHEVPLAQTEPISSIRHDASDASDELTRAAAPPPAQKAPKAKATRKRLSAADRQAMRESIISAYNAGDPFRAILLRLGLREEQLSKMLAELIMAGVLTPIASAYEVLPVSQAIRSIPGLTVSADGYIRVEKADSGIILTPYIPEEEEHE